MRTSSLRRPVTRTTIDLEDSPQPPQLRKKIKVEPAPAAASSRGMPDAEPEVILDSEDDAEMVAELEKMIFNGIGKRRSRLDDSQVNGL